MADDDRARMTAAQLQARITADQAQLQKLSVLSSVPGQVISQLRDYQAAGGDPAAIITEAQEWLEGNS